MSPSVAALRANVRSKSHSERNSVAAVELLEDYTFWSILQLRQDH